MEMAAEVWSWVDALRDRGHTPYRQIDRRKRPFGETPHQPDLIVANFAELAVTLA